MITVKYIIVPKADAEDNWSMLNHSTSDAWSQVKKNLADTQWLFKTDTDEPHAVFDVYQWYCCAEIIPIMDSAEWEPV